MESVACAAGRVDVAIGKFRYCCCDNLQSKGKGKEMEGQGVDVIVDEDYSFVY